MNRPRTTALLAAAVLFAAGCGDAISSMTEHWFYGYVTAVGAGELCLSDARTEDRDAERCFRLADPQLASDVGDGDLVKVRYERGEQQDHGGGAAVSVRMVRRAGRSDS